MTDPARIRERAYQLWVQRGRPLWHALEDWVKAEQQLLPQNQLLYRVDPPATQWGQRINLKVIKDEIINGVPVTSGLDFGTQQGSVALVGATTKPLTIESWTPSTIIITLPPHDPNFAPRVSPDLYSVSVTTSAVTGVMPYLVQNFVIASASVPLPKLCDAAVLAKALLELIELKPSATKLEPLQPMSRDGLPNPVSLDVVKAPAFDAPLTEEAKFLKDLLLNQGSELTFVYNVVGPSGFKGPTGGMKQVTLDALPLNLLSGLIPRPNLVAHEADAGSAAWSFTIDVDVTATRLPGCERATAKLKSPAITQLPLRVPTIVAGFDKRDWDGDRAIVFIRDGSELLDGVLDRRNGDDRRAVFKALTLQYEIVTRALEVLGPLFPTIPGVSTLLDVKYFIQKADDQQNAELVLTAEKEHDDMGNYQPSWYDMLSSLFIIGVPDGKTFKLFEGKDQSSHELHIRVPANHLVASYWTLHESAFHKDHRHAFSSRPVVPDPGVDQEGRADQYPWGSFGNMPKSFEWS